MRLSLKTSIPALVLSSALVGGAAPAFADGYYQGIDPHNRPVTESRPLMSLPPVTVTPDADVDRMPTGSIDRMPTGSIFDGRTIDRDPYPEYTPGEGQYYRGIVPPRP